MTHLDRHFFRLLFASTLIFVQGCVTSPVDYTGPHPDFSLKGEATQTEIKKFSLNDSYWAGYPFEMGPQDTKYTLRSLRPIIKDVSPAADRKYSHLETLGIVELSLLAGTVGFFIAGTIAPEGSTRTALYTAELACAIPGIFVLPFVNSGIATSAAKTYNRDLKERFTPGLQGRIEF